MKEPRVYHVRVRTGDTARRLGARRSMSGVALEPGLGQLVSDGMIFDPSDFIVVLASDRSEWLWPIQPDAQVGSRSPSARPSP